MSQSRFELSTHSTYKEAQAAKDKELESEPDAVLQIRKGINGFRLVRRFKNNEAKVIEDSKTKTKRNKKRGREDFSWLTGKS